MGVSHAVWQTEGMTFGPVSAGFSVHLARVLVFFFFFFFFSVSFAHPEVTLPYFTFTEPFSHTHTHFLRFL